MGNCCNPGDSLPREDSMIGATNDPVFEIEKNMILQKNKEMKEYLRNGDVQELHYSSGSFYKGELFSEKPNGKGSYVSPKLKFDGNWINGRPNGYGKVEFSNGETYEGSLLNGVPHGKGVHTIQKYRYEGDFENGKYHGQGVLNWNDGKRYQGSFSNGLMNGHGTFNWPNGMIYEGNYKNGKKDGKGKLIYDSNRYFEGLWKGGLPEGGKVKSDGNEFDYPIKKLK